jgi:hypothetical protein
MVTLTINDHWDDGKRIHVVGQFNLTGSYTTGGDLIPWGNPLIKSASLPTFCEVPASDGYVFRATTTGFLKAMQCTNSVAPLGELPAGAYPSTLLTSKVVFHAIFPKFI